MFANAAAPADVNGVDIWDINGNESVYYEYARFNSNVTNLYAAQRRSASSDHNPEIVGINTDAGAAGRTEIQILGINDFHGRILNEAGTNGTTAGRRRVLVRCGEAVARGEPQHGVRGGR